MPNASSVFHGSEGILYLGPKIWDIVPLENKVLLPSRKLLKSGSQKTVLVGYVRNTDPI